MELNKEWKFKYNEALMLHLDSFREAALMLGIEAAQVAGHDLSKTSPEEYPAYVRKFGGGIKDDADFLPAWLHHIHNNPHHPEHWFLPSRGTHITVLKMPKEYVREMVADWMGSSKAYTGDWHMGRGWSGIWRRSGSTHFPSSACVTS